MLIFKGLWWFKIKSARVTAAALCTDQFGKPVWKDGSKIEMGSSGLNTTWTTSASAHWQWWRRKTKGRREGGRGNEYLTVTHGVKERNVSLLTSLCFSFLLSTPPPLPLSLPPPPFTCAPCRLKYASIIVWEIGSRGLCRKVCLAWGCYAVVNDCLWSTERIYALKVNWSYHTATTKPQRENDAEKCKGRG